MRFRQYTIALLCTIAFSCSGLPLQSQKPVLSGDPSTYCALLNVSSNTRVFPPPPKPFMGISFIPVKLDQQILPCKNNNVIQIADVMSQTPAMEAGLKEGDVILALNGNPICQDTGDISVLFKNMVEQQKVGSTVKMDILRDGERINLSAKLIEMPAYHQPEAQHQFINGCEGYPRSLLEKTLFDQNTFSLFDTILSGLYQQSNYVHNIDWFYKKQFDPFQTKEFTYMIRHPLQAGLVAQELSGRLIERAEKKEWHIGDIMNILARLGDIELKSYPMTVEITFPGLIKIMEMTKERVEQSLKRLDPEEKNLLLEKALNPWDDDQWNTVLELILKIDLAEFSDAFSPLLSFLSERNLSLLREDLTNRFGNEKGAVLFEAVTPAGKVIVGGQGLNIYQEDAALILDLGGDDLYLNNAGGTRPGMPVSMVIDWGGNDLYLTKENFSQGSGVLGGGFLLDLSGNDYFYALDGSQGAGFLGVGLLYHGTGDSIYNARSFSQGVGQIGIGLIWNKNGDTRYLCSEAGQGLGIMRGAGILIDQSGNDYYQLGGLQPDFRDPLRSTLSMGQGFGKGLMPEKGKYGTSGGIGILIDESGDDTYSSDYFAQGASYYYGVGLLNDLSGNDRYISGRYAQGAGIHSSVGVFIDQGGDDFYYASFGVAQGVGHDFGVGYFEDKQGNDHYFGGILVQGAATRGGIGALIDTRGNDRYMCSDEGQAYSRDEGGIGILIDTEQKYDHMNKNRGPEPVKLGF